MSGDERDFIKRRRELTSSSFSPLQGKAPKKILAILTETLGEHAPSKTGWPSLNVVIFPRVMRLVLDDPNSDHPGDYRSHSRANLGRPPKFS